MSLPTNQPSNQLPNQPMDHLADLLGCLYEIMSLKYLVLLDSDSVKSIVIEFQLSKPRILIFEPKFLQNWLCQVIVDFIIVFNYWRRYDLTKEDWNLANGCRNMLKNWMEMMMKKSLFQQKTTTTTKPCPLFAGVISRTDMRSSF